MKGPKDGVVCASINSNLLNQGVVNMQHCCLAISVGQPYHESTKLEAAIHLIDKTFAKCTIAIGDTLQRHNMMDLKDPYQAALKAGDEWLDRNRAVIERLSIPYEIHRWDEWRLQKNYQSQLTLVKIAYENDAHFRKGFEKTIDIFTDRLKKRCEKPDLTSLQQNSLDFLLEECTIIMLMWQQEHYHYIAYPGEMIDALAVTYRKFVQFNGLNILTWLPLQFKRYSMKYLTSPKTEHIFPAEQLDCQMNVAKAA